MAAVECQDVHRSFGPVKAVSGLELSIAEGEIFGLVGPDGAGKTTTFRMLTGLLAPDRGVAIVDSHRIEAGKRAGAELRDSIGYMPQRFGLYFDLTVEENMRFYADLFELDDATWRERGERLLAMTRLGEFTDRPAGKLSGGMKQKLGLTCALLHQPNVLLLDEPTNGVDPVSRRDFWKILSGLAGSKMTILLATSYLDEAQQCDRVGLMYDGRLIACDRPDALRSPPADAGSSTLRPMEDVFIDLVRQHDEASASTTHARSQA